MFLSTVPMIALFQELQADYLKMQTRADDLRREIKSLHKHIEDMGRQHKEALNTQVGKTIRDCFGVEVA